MKRHYIQITVVAEVPEGEYEVWSESADETFHCAGLHNPEEGFYLVKHREVSQENIVEDFGMNWRTRVFTEEGGI